MLVKRVILPPDALDDVLTLIRLPEAKLRELVRLFSKAEAAFPKRQAFVNQVAENLTLNISDARTVVLLCHFLLLHFNDQLESADEIINDLRQFVENGTQQQAVLSDFDTKRELLKSLVTPQPAPLRARKIRRLQTGPIDHVHSFRTICQLRPLFEGEEENEEIVGLVSMIVLEIEAADEDGVDTTVAFGMDQDDLAELEKVVKRTQAKLRAIADKYGSEILTVE